jgi:Phosphatidylinositol-4-phosphate 5-Kinase
MDNLLGSDFMNIERIYDLKGSTVGRIVKLNEAEKTKSGLKVLKDLNFCELEEKLMINSAIKDGVHQIIERDSKFLAS